MRTYLGRQLDDERVLLFVDFFDVCFLWLSAAHDAVEKAAQQQVKISFRENVFVAVH